MSKTWFRCNTDIGEQRINLDAVENVCFNNDGTAYVALPSANLEDDRWIGVTDPADIERLRRVLDTLEITVDE